MQQLGVAVIGGFGVEIFLRHLGDIADDMAEGAAVIIGALFVHVGDDARDIIGVEADLGKVFPVEVGGDDGRDRTFVLIDVAQDAAARGHGLRQDIGQLVQGVVDVRDFVGFDHDAERRPVAGDQLAVTVEDVTARRRDQTKVKLVGGGQGLIFSALDDLEMGQAPGQGEQAEGHRAPHEKGAPGEHALTFIDIGKDDGRFGHLLLHS